MPQTEERVQEGLSLDREQGYGRGGKTLTKEFLIDVKAVMVTIKKNTDNATMQNVTCKKFRYWYKASKITKINKNN